MPATGVIRLRCPKLVCGRILAVVAEARGEVVKCRYCGTAIRVPARSAADEAPPPPPDAAA